MEEEKEKLIYKEIMKKVENFGIKNFFNIFDWRRNNQVLINFFQGNIFIEINSQFTDISVNINS